VEVPASPPQPEQYGVWGEFSDSQLIGNNIARIRGIALYYVGSSTFITRNNFQENYEGILFSGDAERCVNNMIHYNNFNRNSRNVNVPFIRNPPFNSWDNGTVGNYWSDYTGTDADGDGIGDTPYNIETVYYDYQLGKNVTVLEGQDRFPLMTPIKLNNALAEPSEQAKSPVPSPPQDNMLTATTQPSSSVILTQEPKPSTQTSTKPESSMKAPALAALAAAVTCLIVFVLLKNVSKKS
jgi:hypothetical protein